MMVMLRPVFVAGVLLSSIECFAPSSKTIFGVKQPSGHWTSPSPRHNGCVELRISSTETPVTADVPVLTEEEDVPPPNLLQAFVEDIRRKDINEIINTGVVLAAAGLILWQVTTMNADVSRGWTAEEVAARIPLDVWASYSEVLDREPIVTKAVTSATVYTIGDVIAQRTEGTSVAELDRMRILRSLLAGLIGHGPMSHVWYNFCDSFFDDVLHLTQWWSFVPKVIFDQATWGPFWNNMYILLLGVMKLESWETMWNDMKRTTVPLIVSGLKLWPLAHCVTYGLVPVENRLLWVDLVEIVWVTILATTAASAVQEQVPEPEEELEEALVPDTTMAAPAEVGK